MQDVEENVPLKDPGVAESGSCKPKIPRRTQKDKSILEDQPPCLTGAANDLSKQSSEIGRNHDLHKEEKGLPPNSLEVKVKETMHNAFWDHLKEQLSAIPPDFTCALELLKEIKERTGESPTGLEEANRSFCRYCYHARNRLRSEIEDALNADHLQQEAEHGSLNILHLAKYILNMMTLLCAPVRDEAVQKLDNITDPACLLRGIFQVLGLMQRDRMNYTIQSLQPHLQEHSIQHERAKFQELLNKQPSLLDHTTRWLTQAAADLTTLPPACSEAPDPCSVACPSPNEATHSPELLSPTMVLSQGFLNLLLWDPDDEEFPETLLEDRAQLQELQSQLLHLTILASVLLVTSSFSVSVLFGSPQFVDKLKRRIKALTEEFDSRPEEAMLTVSEQVSQEILQSLKNMGLTAPSSDSTASLMGQLQDIAHKENCVRSVIGHFPMAVYDVTSTPANEKLMLNYTGGHVHIAAIPCCPHFPILDGGYELGLALHLSHADQRIHLFLKCCLVLGVQRSLLDLPGGLALIEAELAELGQKFVNLTYHNQRVFGPYYTEILKTLVPPSQALGAKAGSP